MLVVNKSKGIFMVQIAHARGRPVLCGMGKADCHSHNEVKHWLSPT